MAYGETAVMWIQTEKVRGAFGRPAGNTALCTVGRSGNDLHYRGYDILDLPEHCEFEEVAYLLLYGKLPNREQLAEYKHRLRGMRGLPASIRTALEQLPARPLIQWTCSRAA